MSLTTDAQAMLMLCSRLGLGRQTEPAPLTLREWNSLAQAIFDSPLSRPGNLLGLSAMELASELNIEPQAAEHTAALLSRGGALAIEMERMEKLGIWVLTRADEDYPHKYRQRLRQSAPAILFGSGDKHSLGLPGLAVVGSRHLTPELEDAAQRIGHLCGRSSLVLYSGGAKGVDNMSTSSAIEASGSAVSILAQGIEAAIRRPEVRLAIAQGNLTLVTPYSPDAGFSVGAAMGRNKLVYALSDYALVISSDLDKGGTWAGATEALAKKWVPVFVLQGTDVPEGNRALLQKGAQPFPHDVIDSDLDLSDWLKSNATPPPADMVQAQLL
jgi:predicted Rossmann fold nucleotide-binding protein DprA/Smf involved in DNA uptake